MHGQQDYTEMHGQQDYSEMHGQQDYTEMHGQQNIKKYVNSRVNNFLKTEVAPLITRRISRGSNRKSACDTFINERCIIAFLEQISNCYIYIYIYIYAVLQACKGRK